ncbi:MAG: DUF711 family protein [Candidatus Gribaldobacteria bacterium]|nr:DUF711 family protein [Candidatus Gribaldobacteria bacterium]
MENIVRTICLFTDEITAQDIEKLEKIYQVLQGNNFSIQTKRICLSGYKTEINDQELLEKGILLGLGEQTFQGLKENFTDFLQSENKAINLDLTNENIIVDQADILFEIIRNKPENTFRFTFGFNLPVSSPYFPSAKFGQKGFSVGLQPTDLSVDCKSVEQWLEKMKAVWQEIDLLLKPIDGYLGIDSSIAPLFQGPSSLVNFVKRLGLDFSHSVTTDIYTKISKFIKENNPKPIGLGGLMLPCLEDFELAEEYEKGNFSIERNMFLSLHSGLGIDTYPIAVNQNKERVVEILRLMQQLSSKYRKPLSARFVSDGQAKIGEKTDFKNQYLKDVIVREL